MLRAEVNDAWRRRLHDREVRHIRGSAPGKCAPASFPAPHAVASAAERRAVPEVDSVLDSAAGTSGQTSDVVRDLIAAGDAHGAMRARIAAAEAEAERWRGRCEAEGRRAATADARLEELRATLETERQLRQDAEFEVQDEAAARGALREEARVLRRALAGRGQEVEGVALQLQARAAEAAQREEALRRARLRDQSVARAAREATRIARLRAADADKARRESEAWRRLALEAAAILQDQGAKLLVAVEQRTKEEHAAVEAQFLLLQTHEAIGTDVAASSTLSALRGRVRSFAGTEGGPARDEEVDQLARASSTLARQIHAKDAAARATDGVAAGDSEPGAVLMHGDVDLLHVDDWDELNLGDDGPHAGADTVRTPGHEGGSGGRAGPGVADAALVPGAQAGAGEVAWLQRSACACSRPRQGKAPAPVRARLSLCPPSPARSTSHSRRRPSPRAHRSARLWMSLSRWPTARTDSASVG